LCVAPSRAAPTIDTADIALDRLSSVASADDRRVGGGCESGLNVPIYDLRMCGRVIQSAGPIGYAIVEGLDVNDSRPSNYPRRWNGAPSQELLVIREKHKTGERSLDLLRWGLIPYWRQDPTGGRKPINAKAETVARLANVPGSIPKAPVHPPGRRLL
jgi:SOS response associated peptidase (SRAP)